MTNIARGGCEAREEIFKSGLNCNLNSTSVIFLASVVDT